MTANNISFVKYLRFMATGIVVASVIVMTLALVAAPAFAAVGSDDGASSSVGSDDGSTGNNSAGSDDGSTGGSVGSDDGSTDGGSVGSDDGSTGGSSVGSDDGSTGGNSVGSDDGSTGDPSNPSTPSEEENNNSGGNGRISRGGGSSTSQGLVTVSGISFNETGGAVILSWTTSRSAESWVSVNGARTNSASGFTTSHYVSLSDLVAGRTYQVQAFAMSNGKLVSGPIRSITPTFLSNTAGDVTPGSGTVVGTSTTGTVSTSTTATSTATSSNVTGTSTTNSDLAATAFYAKPLTWILVILALIIIGVIIFFWKQEDEDETTGTPSAQ